MNDLPILPIATRLYVKSLAYNIRSIFLKMTQVEPRIRKGAVKRHTAETQISVAIDIDGNDETQINSGIGFLDHMLHAFQKHSGVSLSVSCVGDLQVDDHHSVEDIAISLGTAIKEAMGDCRGIMRYGFAYCPLDEALSRAVIDFSGRGFADSNTNLQRERLGELSCELVDHFFISLATAAGMTVHIDTLKGKNDHHKCESAFKAFAVAFRAAVAYRPGDKSIPSTKGVL